MDGVGEVALLQGACCQFQRAWVRENPSEGVLTPFCFSHQSISQRAVRIFLKKQLRYSPSQDYINPLAIIITNSTEDY